MTKLTGEEIRAPLAEPPYPRPSYMTIPPRGEHVCPKCVLPCGVIEKETLVGTVLVSDCCVGLLETS